MHACISRQGTAELGCMAHMDAGPQRITDKRWHSILRAATLTV